MSRAYNFAIFLLLLFGTWSVTAQKLEVGAKFPLERLSQKDTSEVNTLIAFVPSLTYDCDYASMLTQSFYYYFDEGLAFDGSSKTRIFIIVKDTPNEGKSTQNILGRMNVIYDEKGDNFRSFGVKLPSGKNGNSTVVLLDKHNIVAFLDDAYRSQGEHLKPLENRLKELNGVGVNVPAPINRRPLKLWNVAPDFPISPTEKLSNLRGRVVLLTFYPAAFSGTLARPLPADLFSSLSTRSMSCYLQIDSLDVKLSDAGKKERRIAITSSTPKILEKWKELLGTYNIEYANDIDYSVSSLYSAFNPNGYNDRVSVIIDKRGKIVHIDDDYGFGDDEILNRKIEALNKK